MTGDPRPILLRLVPRMRPHLAFVAILALAPATLRGQVAPLRGAVRLDSTTALEPKNARVLWVEYLGRRALKLAPLVGHERDTNQEMEVALTQSDFRNGVIQLDVSGARRGGYRKAEDITGFKGMIGVTFRLHGDSAERIYVRPENARSSLQLFRNFTTQYESSPDFPWDRLRRENQGVYESYVDMESGAWVRLRIEVSGAKARLYVNGASQPCLIVNDLKHGDSHGKVALWARISTDAYFSNLRIDPTR